MLTKSGECRSVNNKKTFDIQPQNAPSEGRLSAKPPPQGSFRRRELSPKPSPQRLLPKEGAVAQAITLKAPSEGGSCRRKATEGVWSRGGIPVRLVSRPGQKPTIPNALQIPPPSVRLRLPASSPAGGRSLFCWLSAKWTTKLTSLPLHRGAVKERRQSRATSLCSEGDGKEVFIRSMHIITEIDFWQTIRTSLQSQALTDLRLLALL